ncbi:MAG: DUF362 domain-containing protein [Syntrophobacterales bacterium]|nr:DUF362 domain-containing protein [Syntrophobacterales bacterium]
MAFTVGISRYERPYESLRIAVERAGGLPKISPGSRVFIKPNIVTWVPGGVFPKWGVITTSRIVEDVVRILKEGGFEHIKIGEGIVYGGLLRDGITKEAFQTLGYYHLKRRYGIETIDLFEGPFKRVQIADGISLNFSVEALESDLIVDIPVLKTHAQTVVSLGIKNLKGLIDIPSRKRCHSKNGKGDLHFYVGRLFIGLPPIWTVIDGIFSNERGPGFDGTARRTNLIIVSHDVFSADKVGSTILGYPPSDVPHLVHASKVLGRPIDLSDVQVVGEDLNNLISFHKYSFDYNRDNSLPAVMDRMGIRGLSYWKYDETLCTYCSFLNGAILTAIAKAWAGTPWDEVEVLTGKVMKPSGTKKHTILLGKCMSRLHRNNSTISHPIFVKGCPPKPDEVVKAFREVGIHLDGALLEHPEGYVSRFLKKYEGREDFSEEFFRID